MTRTQLERQTYAMRRYALATDRAILAEDENDRDRARRWAYAWHACAYARLDILVRLNAITGKPRQPE